MESTIAAISTGLTPSGIIIVRMSGNEAIQIADRIYRGKNKKKKLADQKTHTIHYGFIHDKETDIDEVLVSVMKAPYTYTGEDIIEINCHGGVLVARKVLELLIREGAVLAEPGEFTKRAFLNGKMDLSRAEAVIDVIDAKNNFALKAGVSNLKGTVEKKIRNIREVILDEVSFIEAALDDPEHYDLTGYTETLNEHLDPVEQELLYLIRQSENGSVLKEGIRTVIAGRPNAGKSSLLNLLSGYEKAIVTEIAGTTRDILEETVRLKDISLILMDTAGIRKTEDIVEKIGVDKAKEALSDADLILYLIDAKVGETEEDREVLDSLDKKKVIVLKNKTDLIDQDEKQDHEKETDTSLYQLNFSALTGEGLESLENKILQMFEKQEIVMNDEVIITNERQKACLIRAENALKLVREGIENGASEEFLTVDLMDIYSSLSQIIGEEVGEDVINRVFEKFCMGK